MATSDVSFTNALIQPLRHKQDVPQGQFLSGVCLSHITRPNIWVILINERFCYVRKYPDLFGVVSDAYTDIFTKENI